MMRSVRRPSVLAAALVSCALGATVAYAADRFVRGIEDLPLMPGLTEAADAGVVFDTPSGRIVQTEATGPISRDRVLAFYAESLPQLGWRSLAADLYHREDEVLRIEFDQAGDQSTTVRFALSPASATDKP